jgi:ABC-type iron transport system FetAB ATPase subunit
MEGVELWWPGAAEPVLTVDKLEVRPGTSVAVFGGVATGKSSLLLGLLSGAPPAWRGATWDAGGGGRRHVAAGPRAFTDCFAALAAAVELGRRRGSASQLAGEAVAYCPQTPFLMHDTIKVGWRGSTRDWGGEMPP